MLRDGRPEALRRYERLEAIQGCRDALRRDLHEVTAGHWGGELDAMEYEARAPSAMLAMKSLERPFSIGIVENYRALIDVSWRFMPFILLNSGYVNTMYTIYIYILGEKSYK